jgi:hypothetical protein
VQKHPILDVKVPLSPEDFALKAYSLHDFVLKVSLLTQLGISCGALHRHGNSWLAVVEWL